MTTAEPDIAALAALVTEPARAAILVHLLDGRSWTASELARIAGVGAPTASAHLRRLLEGRLIQVSPAGRHRYFRIANAEIAQLLEQMARLAPVKRVETPGAKRASVSLRRCRLCYDHLAGRIGVAIADGMLARNWLVEAEPWYRLTDAGRSVLAELSIGNVDGRTCMDWSERKLHIAGPLGKQLAQALLSKGWLRRDLKSRAVWITPNGAESLRGLFGVSVPD
ncbi:MAG TPA: helix-turn-helix domain-containing protein [Steroidobacteraceae bacterium]|jgi:DNA-binding transcriptional ArsR family regulator